MSQPAHHLGHRGHYFPRGEGRAVDQNHRKTQCAGRDQLGLGPRTACVLGDDVADIMMEHQRLIAISVKRTPRQNNRAVGQRRRFGRIDQAQQIVVRLGGKACEILLADGQKNPCGTVGQGSNGSVHAGNMAPVIVVASYPRRALKREQWHASETAGLYRIAAHLGGKRVGGIDDRADVLSAQIRHQAANATEASNPRGQGLRHRAIGAASVREHRVLVLGSQSPRQNAGLGSAAQDKNARHG
ncbi:MAG: hypothetical protein JWS11_842 [Cypionkella sp.]|nr:hypothetical protein [Cypionkella sp.]